MKRGTFRARNLMLVKGNSEAEVGTQSRLAFASVPDLKIPIRELARLHGVGPATASAALAALRPDLFPFFDEDVAVQIPGLGPVAFTSGYYARYGTALRERAAVLEERAPGHRWTAQDLAQALWATRPSPEKT